MPGGADALASSQYAQASTIDDGKIVLAGFVPVRTGEHDLAVVVEHKAVDDVQVEPLIGARRARSEEHTSELQSLMRISYAVFCLKKKKSTLIINTENLSAPAQKQVQDEQMSQTHKNTKT